MPNNQKEKKNNNNERAGLSCAMSLSSIFGESRFVSQFEPDPKTQKQNKTKKTTPAARLKGAAAEIIVRSGMICCGTGQQRGREGGANRTSWTTPSAPLTPSSSTQAHIHTHASCEYFGFVATVCMFLGVCWTPRS